jgi:FkbM family methyltransferase
MILDVGANEGQFALSMRKLGYLGNIRSFEPLSKTYEILKLNAKDDQKWDTFNFGFGNKDAEEFINVSENTVSSSLLDILPDHLKEETTSRVIARERIRLKRLDTFFGEYDLNANSIFLKLDVQGYEKFVLEGAITSLNNIGLIQAEMSLVPLYSGECLLNEMIENMNRLGYKLYNLVSGFNNFESGQLFQVDGIFARSGLIK